MRRSLLNKQILPKPLRQALVLITLLLLPSATWGEVKYGDGVELTYNSDQSAYIGTGVQWNVSPALNTSEATEITDKLFLTFTTPLKGSLSSITLNMETNIAYTDVKLYKTSNLSTNGTDPIGTFTYSSETGGPKYTFTSSSDITLDNEYIQVAFVKNDGYPTIETTNIKSITLSFSSISYNLTVAGIPVTDANTAGIEGSGITEGTVTFTPAEGTNPATLTLNSATIIPESGCYGIEYSGTGALTISLKGSNTISCSGVGIIQYSGTSAPTLAFTKGGTETCSLQLETVGVDLRTIGGFEDVSCATGLYRIDDTTGGNAETTYKTTITSLGGGSGSSSDDPIIIKTAEDLRDFAKLVNRGTITNQYIKLNPEGEELDCNGLTGFEPIGIYGNPFIGKFDGNNFIIKNLTYSTDNTAARVGLFGYVGNEDVSDTKIEKLTLSNCSFNGGEYVGGIVGELKNGTIENCVLSSCTVKSGNAQIPYTGGIAGWVDNGTINTCTFNSGLVDCTTAYSGEPSGGVYAGGIVGYIYSTNSVTVSLCTVSSTNVKSVQSGSDGAHDIYVGGIVGCSLGKVAISGNKVTTTDNTKKISCQSSVDYTVYHCGAIIGKKGDETTLTNNTYEYDVTTEIAETPKSGYTQRGIGQDIGQEIGSYDIPNQVMMAGTKKVTISATGLNDSRKVELGTIADNTYYLTETEGEGTNSKLKALYTLPDNNMVLQVTSEAGYKPTFTLSDETVKVTPTEAFENGAWTIQYAFKMAEDDITATVAFARDLESKDGETFLYTLETHQTDQDSYVYTGEPIEPTIYWVDADPDVVLVKGTDYEVKDYWEVKEGVATPMYEEDGTTPKVPVNVGSYKISITGKGDYSGTRELEFSITKSPVYWSDDKWTSPTGKTNLKYTGEDLELVTAATVPEGVTIKYCTKSIEALSEPAYQEDPDEVWSEDVPTGKEIGYYAVFYKVEGGDNYEDWGPCEVGIAVNIGRGVATITAENQTTTYNGSPIEYDKDNITLSPETISKDGIGISYFEPDPNNPDNPKSLEGAPTAAGTYTVKITLVDDHFDAETVNATLTIEQLDISQADITLDNTELTYNGEQQTVNVTKVMVGDIEVPIDCYEVSGNTEIEAGDYKLTVTAKTMDSSGNPIKNNFTGSAEKDWKINHRTASATELGFSTETQTASTYYNPNEDFNLPEGYVGYIITGINGTEVLTTRVSYIPKGVAVLVEKGTSSENATDEVPNPDLLPLKGTLEPKDVTSITGGTVYVLYNGEFVKSTSGTIPGKRCYLLIDTSVAAGTRSFSIDHGDGSTGIDSALVYDNDEKAGDKWHDLQGRSIEKPTRAGLYIKNGKKVVIK